jgi:hypothetical protein
MDVTYFVYGLILLCLAVMGAYRLDVQGVNASEGQRWWKDSAAPFGEEGEGFIPAPKASGSPQGSLQGHEGFIPAPKDERSGFESQEKEDALLDHPPGKPAPVELYDKQPYHLLSDRLSPALDGSKGTLSCVNSRSCYATDAEAYLSRVGNYRQMTNNYKHEYPDSCSALRQELVLGFYSAMPLSVSRS